MQIRPDSLFARYEQRQASQQASGQGSVREALSTFKSTDSSGTTPTTGNFLELISQGVGKVNEMQQSSTREVERMLSGEDVESAEVYSGLQKADMAFRLLVQVRNKLMQAYEEINSIRI